MTQATLENTDRRAYFRINDRLVLDFRPITPAEARELGEMILSSPAAPTAVSSAQQLSSLQTAFQHLVDQVGHRDRDVARALRMLDDKISLLASHLQILQNPIDDDSAQKVSLSAGGLAFLSQTRIKDKTPIELRLQLLPSGITVHALGTVVSCTDNTSPDANKKPYFIRSVFTHMSETDRNLLVKHTLTRQAEDLRNQKEAQA